MIIVAVADIHGDLSALERILHCEAQIDALFLLGDITNFGDERSAEDILRVAQDHAAAVFGVYGNCDTESVARLLVERNVSLPERVVTLGGIAWTGVGRSLPCPGGTPSEMNEESFATLCAKAREMITKDIPFGLVTHQPPWDTVCDRSFLGHIGSKAIRDFIEREKPNIVLCGHVHEGAGVDKIDQCIVANPGPARRGMYVKLEVDSGVIRNLELRSCEAHLV